MQLEWRISDPENRLVGLGDSISSLFKRKKRKAVRPAVLDAPPPPPVSQLFGQEPGPARAPEAGGLPRFKATAADHIDRRRSDRFTAMRMRVRNAFTPSQPIVDGKMFAGRQDLLSHLIGSIEDQRLHLVLYGERGIGKTSLLHVLAEAARDARYIVVYSSCGSASSFQETFGAAAAEMPLLFHSGFGPTTEEAEAGSSMADLLPDNFTPRQFADLCAKLTGTRVLIFLDEFDRCESSDFRRDVAELMKFLSDRSVRVQLVIGGVAADLAELVEHIPSIRRNILAVRVPQMSDDEVRQMVARGERVSGITYDAAAQDLVVRIARGWPYIAVLVCHHAGLHALDVGRDVVLEDDISAALDTAIGEVRPRMRKRIAQQVDRLLEEGAGKALMTLAGASLAAGGEFGPADITSVAAKAADANDAKRVAEKLAEDQLIIQKRDDGPRYGFVDDSLAPYLWYVGVQQALLSLEQPAPRANAG